MVAQALCLTVWDSGAGLPPEVQPRLLGYAPVGPGGGPGLRLLRDLVTSMKGACRLSRTDEDHSSVIVSLPCARTEESAGHA